MSIEISYREEPGCLVAAMSGAWRTEDAKRAIEAVRAEADRRQLTQLLVDARELSRPDNELTRFHTGEHIALIWGHPFRIAMLLRPELYNGYAELVALNRGATGKVFFEEAAALEWLGQGDRARGED